MASLFTSESVTEGHPDKVADAISDAVLDQMLAQDPASHTAIETLIANGVVIVAGEATTESYVEIAQVARDAMVKIGYDSFSKGLDGQTCGVMVALNQQSPDIAAGVSNAWEARHGQARDALDVQGAGDQGMMFGYACDETSELMPLPIDLAHRLSERLAQVRREHVLDYLRPDGKTQVTIAYEGDRPVRVDNVVISAQHRADIDVETTLTNDIRQHVVQPVLAGYPVDASQVGLLVNPTGKFVVGGPMGDAGLTGRKIIVDTYGGMARHGGGAFSGKDASKVDRSAAYAMRWVAKTVVAAGLARRCETRVSYAIGKSHPTSFAVDTFGTGAVPDQQIADAIAEVFDLRPAAIVRDLHLLAPIFSAFTNYGHFGRRIAHATWEDTGRADDLGRAVRG